MTTEDIYRVRWRGKESGPFSISDLKTMLARNEVSLLHEVKCSGQWLPLEDVVKCGRSDTSVPDRAIPQSVPVVPEASERVLPPAPPPDDAFYIAKNGVKQGPFTKSMIQQLVAVGVFHRDDLAWKNGIACWKPLMQIVEIPVSSPSLTPPGLQTSAPNPLPTDQSSNRLATGMAAFAMFHSNEVRKELRELNQNLEELQNDAGASEVSDGGAWDCSEV